MAKKPHRAERNGAIDWAKQQRFDVEFAKQILLSRGEIAPMFVIHTPEHTKLVVTAWENPEQKHVTQRMVALLAAADGAVGVTFIAEAWQRNVAHHPGESDTAFRARAMALAPSDAEDREEVVVVQCEYRDATGRHLIGSTLDIVRDAAGKPRAAPQRIDFDGAVAEQAVQMLCDEPLTAPQREMAHRLYAEMAQRMGIKTETKIIHPAGHA